MYFLEQHCLSNRLCFAGRLCRLELVGHYIFHASRKGWLVRDVVKRLCRKLGDDAADPRYIITEPRVGYRMAAGEGD